MPTIITNKQNIKQILGNLNDKDLDYKMNMIGLGVEKITDTKIEVEITPNRPDLLSQQGINRYLNTLLKKPQVLKYKINKPEKDYKVIIEKSVKKVRPFTACAIIKNLKLNDEKIKELIDIQERLHASYGRNRKKLAIGIYPLEQIKLPIKYLAKKPEDIKFIPLESNKEMNARQILSQHPTGREYAHLLKDKEVFPIFEDANKEILSMPPIINSQKTGKITENTKEVFIECSGHNLLFLQKTLNIIVTTIADMEGEIYEMEIQDKKSYTTPNLEPEKMLFSIENINKTLGLELSEKQIKNLLEKMGIGYEKDKEKSIALIPAYRIDILHEIDLSEEIAIAYGYDKFEPEIPEISTIGQEDSTAVLKKKIAEILTGLNLLEISTYHLSTKEKQFKKINIKDFKNQMIEVLDSKTENNILRNSLLAQSIQILSENSDASYPQKIFELGKTFFHDDKSDTETGIKETENLCVSLCYEKANFTEIKQILDYLMRMLDKDYEIKEIKNPSFINGRCGEIIINNKPIGILGEINPTVLKNNKIKMPTASLEIEIEDLINY